MQLFLVSVTETVRQECLWIQSSVTLHTDANCVTIRQTTKLFYCYVLLCQL